MLAREGRRRSRRRKSSGISLPALVPRSKTRQMMAKRRKSQPTIRAVQAAQIIAREVGRVEALAKEMEAQLGSIRRAACTLLALERI